MSTKLKCDINAQGYGDQELRDAEGGNNGRGVLEQTRQTGIMATGGAGSRKSPALRMEKGRK